MRSNEWATGGRGFVLKWTGLIPGFCFFFIKIFLLSSSRISRVTF